VPVALDLASMNAVSTCSTLRSPEPFQNCETWTTSAPFQFAVVNFLIASQTRSWLSDCSMKRFATVTFLNSYRKNNHYSVFSDIYFERCVLTEPKWVSLIENEIINIEYIRKCRGWKLDNMGLEFPRYWHDSRHITHQKTLKITSSTDFFHIGVRSKQSQFIIPSKIISSSN
jgi:hypothetical protein